MHLDFADFEMWQFDGLESLGHPKLMSTFIMENPLRAFYMCKKYLSPCIHKNNP